MAGYPSTHELAEIKSWDFTKQGLDGFLKLIESIWHWPDWGYVKRGNKLRLHTGGWSGNEDIIHSLKQNFIFWAMCWKVSRVGGHFTFDLTSLRKIKKNPRKP